MTRPPAIALLSEAAPRLATCLGCGCLCDDVEATLDGGRITRLDRACPLGARWFGDGTLPAAVRIDGRDASLDDALAAAADLLFAAPGRTLIYVADDLTTPAHREAVALADRLGATIDAATSDTVADGLLAAQRRGRASATLGELRHRADTVLFWNVDPAERYPRFAERFLDAPAAFVETRTRIAVSLGPPNDAPRHAAPLAVSRTLEAASGLTPFDAHFRFDPADEVDALSILRAVVNGRPPLDLPVSLAPAVELARLLLAGRYVGIVYDAEPHGTPADDARAEALIALSQALNGPTRAALFALRAGGNRSGFESLLTWQTGYPFAVDFGAGFPEYVADESAAARLARGRYDAVLIVGASATVPAAVAAELARLPCVVVGPRASEAAFGPRVAIDTGAGSIHEGGLVLRMDDIPIETVPLLAHPRTAAEVLRSLAARLPARRPQEVA